MPEQSQCLWCGRPLFKDDGEKRWHSPAGLQICQQGRLHHPSLDIPLPLVLKRPHLLERWLDA